MYIIFIDFIIFDIKLQLKQFYLLRVANLQFQYI